MLSSSVVVAHIDRALADQTLAGRVKRVTSSAAPGYECFDLNCACQECDPYWIKDDLLDAVGIMWPCCPFEGDEQRERYAPWSVSPHLFEVAP